MLSAKERHERFITAFNRIDKHLRNLTNKHKGVRMPDVIRSYLELHPGWKDVEAWRAYTSLRNVIEHERYWPYQYLFVPSEDAVRDIERISQDLLKPTTVGSMFLKEVVSVSVDTPITEVLSLIHEKSYSQFPVCGDGKCVGLLTENGITRWLSKQWNTLSPSDFSSVFVQEVLEYEESRENYLYVPKDTFVDDAFYLFRERPLLEALLITKDGESTTEILGIITLWDAMQATESNNK